MTFPSELRELRQWLVWKFEPNSVGKKPRKVPYYVNGSRRSGKQGSDDDRAALTDYDTARASLDGYEGLGFAFLPGDGLVGIDLDAIADTPERAERAGRIIAACRSYTEHSPSGNGVHIICRGNTETFKSNTLGIEVFSGRQFFTMTGQPYGEPLPLATVSDDTFAKLRRTVKAQAGEQLPLAPAPAPQDTGDKLTDALSYVNPDCGYEDWLRVGMALHAELGDGGLSVWDSWSSRSAKYPGPNDTASHWRSFRAGGGVTIATLYGIAKQAGWQPPRRVQPEPTTIDQPTATPMIAATHEFLPDCNDKGKPLATIENVAEICRRLGVTIRYNVISKEEEIIVPGATFSVDNGAGASFSWLMSWCARFAMPTDKLGDFVTYIADQNPYNPVAEWITATPWDGVSRLPALYDTIRTDGDDGLKRTMIYRWLVSACAAAFEPAGVSAHGVLVIQGDQYVGKTAWFKSLVPEHLGLTQDGMTLRPDDRDSVKQAVSFWLVELGELDATFRKADIAALKAFITRKQDVLRRAYARKESHYARRTVFFASVNQREYLADPTGNRRYWTISATNINAQHGIDMQQLWAEVYAAYREGASWHLSRDEVAALNDHNQEYTHIDPIEQRLQTRLEWTDPMSLWEWKTVTEILLSVGVDRPTKQDTVQAGIHLSKAGCQRRFVKGKAQIQAPNPLRID